MMSAKAYALESGWYREYVRPFWDGLFYFIIRKYLYNFPIKQTLCYVKIKGDKGERKIEERDNMQTHIFHSLCLCLSNTSSFA